MNTTEPDSDLAWLDEPEPRTVPRPVWLTLAPWAIDKRMMKQREALELLHGAGLHIVNSYGLFIVYTPGEVCKCRTCRVELQRVINTTPGLQLPSIADGPLNTMIICLECGNKRCPAANFHDNACTKSNEPGQPGSAY